MKATRKTERQKDRKTERQKDIVFFGNIYGLHDAYDGSVFSSKGVCPTLLVHGNRCVVSNGKSYE